MRDDPPPSREPLGDHAARIVANFDRAADRYDDHATVQRRAAERLAQTIAATLGERPIRRALELGCGTGLLTERLLATQPEAAWTVTDLAPRMVERCRDRLAAASPGAKFEVMDARQPASGPFDLIASNLMFQWFPDAPAVAAALAERLAPNGLLAFNTLGAASFTRWRQLDRQANAATAPAFAEPADLASDCRKRLGPRYSVDLNVETITNPHASFVAFLHALRELGAGARVGAAPASVAALRRVVRSAPAGPIEADYEVATLLVRRSPFVP